MKSSMLINELGKGGKIIAAICQDINASEAQLKPTPDAWSIVEVICHVYDEEREDFREHLDMVLHRPEDEWHPIDPTGWVTERHYQNQEPGEMLQSFLNERKRSLNWLRSLTAPNWERIYQAPFGTGKVPRITTATSLRGLQNIRHGWKLNSIFTTPFCWDQIVTSLLLKRVSSLIAAARVLSCKPCTIKARSSAI